MAVSDPPAETVQALAIAPAARRFAGPRDFLRRLLRHRLGMIGMLLLLLTVFAAVAAPWITAYDPNKIDPLNVIEAPSREHLLGTDGLGRDVFTRIMYGARISLYSGGIVVAISMTLGTLIGLVAGYARGPVDGILMRCMDALLAFPGLIFALAITSALGPGLTNAMIAIAVLSVPGAARIVRGATLSLRERDFVIAARVLGAGTSRILFHHILPNTLGPIIVIASLRVGGAILVETGLSFLGLGVQPPTASWGSMVNEGARFLERAPWIAMASGGAIFITVLGANFLGDAVRDLLDPRLRNQGHG